MNRIILAGWLLLLFAAAGCGRSAQPDGEPHEEIATLSYTVVTGRTELFVEFTPLVKDQLTYFAAHFTRMQDYKPVSEGQVTVSLIRAGKGIRHTAEAPSSPGIFRPGLRPVEPGIYQLVFDLEAPGFTDRVVIDSVKVYPDAGAALAENPAGEEGGSAITFLKEQAWKIDFATEEVKRDTIHEVIRTGGEIISAPGDEQTVVAQTAGVVVFNTAHAFTGERVAAGDQLFTITGGNVTGGNIETRFSAARAAYEQARSNYERKKELFEIAAVSKTVFEEAELAYELARTEYENLSAGYGRGGRSIPAGMTGFVKSILVKEGQYVAAGDPMATISRNQTLTLRADVSPQYYQQLQAIRSANFLTSASGKVYSIEEFGGRLLSYGRSASSEQLLIPVYFEIRNQGELMPGAFAEVYLKTAPVTGALVIPRSALMENYGNYSVYVQTGGESFEKRDIETGISDGRSVQVLSGLSEGERIVTRGAYQVKMASMSSQLPAHGHSH